MHNPFQTNWEIILTNISFVIINLFLIGYVTIYLLLIGGIVQIVDAVQMNPVPGILVAIGIVKIIAVIPVISLIFMLSFIVYTLIIDEIQKQNFSIKNELVNAIKKCRKDNK